MKYIKKIIIFPFACFFIFLFWLCIEVAEALITYEKTRINKDKNK